MSSNNSLYPSTCCPQWIQSLCEHSQQQSSIATVKTEVSLLSWIRGNAKDLWATVLRGNNTKHIKQDWQTKVWKYLHTYALCYTWSVLLNQMLANTNNVYDTLKCFLKVYCAGRTCYQPPAQFLPTPARIWWLSWPAGHKSIPAATFFSRQCLLNQGECVGSLFGCKIKLCQTSIAQMNSILGMLSLPIKDASHVRKITLSSIAIALPDHQSHLQEWWLTLCIRVLWSSPCS